MKFDVFLIFVYLFALCQADISLTQLNKNQFEGYVYPKPSVEFKTGNVKPKLAESESKDDIKEGYDYPKPKIAFPLPSETTTLPPTVKAIESIPSTYLPPTIASTYLPPETTTTKKPTTTTTTKKLTTTTRTTTTPKPTERTIIKEEVKEGYDYPKPKIAFPLPSETTTLPPTPKISVKAIESIPSTYLPPTIASTYLPPETTTTKKPTTTTTKKLTTTTKTTTTPKPTERTIIKEEVKEGYDYPKPKIAFPLPSETTTLPPTPKISVKAIESIPSTYLPPTIASTYLPPETTTTKKPTTTTTKKLTTTTKTTTTPKPTERTIIKEEVKEGYDYPKPKIAFPLPSETTTLPPTPKISVKAIESIPSTYLPPETTTTKKPTTTTTKKLTTTTKTTTTPKPTERTIIKEEVKEGYDYPKPKIAFPLPSETTTLPPTPKISVKSIESIASTYLPPETTTTKKPTTTTTKKLTTTTRTTTTPKPTERTIIKEEVKEGYDYPKPKIAFPLPSETTTLPPTPKISVKAIESIPSTYLPPTIASTYLPPETTTTKKPTTTTTKKLTTTTKTTTTPKPTERTIIKEEVKEGYDYPKPKIAFPLPSETTTLPPTPKISVKAIESIPSTYLPPTIASTYLPPETTTTKKPTTTTTKKLTTTTKTTTTPKPTERTIIKEEVKEGYDYPKPKIAFPLPSETTTLPPTPKISVKSIESIASTYLPPETTTTKKPTTTTTKKLTTTTRTTTTPKPTERTIIKEEVKEGYDYPKPKIAFPLPKYLPPSY